MFKNGHIIVIEDDNDDQELLSEVFSELGVTNIVKFFSSCVHALDHLLTSMEKPFLIISDINLPAMTGLELCRKIIERGEWYGNPEYREGLCTFLSQKSYDENQNDTFPKWLLTLLADNPARLCDMIGEFWEGRKG